MKELTQKMEISTSQKAGVNRSLRVSSSPHFLDFVCVLEQELGPDCRNWSIRSRRGHGNQLSVCVSCARLHDATERILRGTRKETTH